MRRTLLLALLVLLTDASAFAQDRAWFFVPGQTIATLPPRPATIVEAAVSDFGRTWIVNRRIELPPHLVAARPAFFRGRFLVWVASDPPGDGRVLVWFDTATNDFTVMPFPSGRGVVNLVVDRHLPRLFGVDSRAIYSIDAYGQVTSFHPPVALDDYRALLVARGKVFLQHLSLDGSQTDVLDAVSGGLLARIPAVQLSSDERRIFTQQPVGTSVLVTVLDTDTLQPVALSLIPRGETFFTLVGDLLVTSSISSGRTWIRAYSSSSFAFVAEAAPGAFYGRKDMRYFSPSRHSPFFVQSADIGPGYFSPCSDHIDVIDPAVPDRIAQHVRVGSLIGFQCMPISIMLAAPDAPTDLRASVVGRTVTLTWDPPANAGDYEIAAGSQPNLRDVAVIRTDGRPQISATNVAPGTYYVRVRAINEIGVSEPSTELRIVVP